MGWVLDHLDDVDADFLAIYGIDLRDPACDIAAEVFFARASRLFAYRGAMREELLIEQRNNEDHGRTAAAPTPASAAQPSRAQPVLDNGETWVSPDEMKALFPDLCDF